MPSHVIRQEWPRTLRVPVRCSLDLTYRCNNVCNHCWLWLPANAPEQRQELTVAEICRIADEARSLGVSDWDISGGEPMLRPDFPEIFDYLTRKARTYTIRTNGTLITPEIVRLLKRPGTKWISVYGATAEVYDHITHNPGGFEQLMRAFALLKEAGVSFTVQLFPMRDNWHQWPQMIELARSLSPSWRVGASWLHLSACASPCRNEQIKRQRLDPADVIALDPPPMDDAAEELVRQESGCHLNDDRLFAACIQTRNEFHIDPYGGMSFCHLIKEPSLRYNLRHGTVREAWEKFIPSLADKVRATARYREACGACEMRADCRWCGTYAWLEHGDPCARVEYLCELARETRRYKQNWLTHHRRFYRMGGITFQLDSDLPITDTTFTPAVQRFAVDGPGKDTVKLRHRFTLEGVRQDDWGTELYQSAPWTISRKGNSWIYRCALNGAPYLVAVFNATHTRGWIYRHDEEPWANGGLNVITLMGSDQILLTRLLADRRGLLVHSAAAILGGKGLLFVGHSGAGKTTTTRLIQERAEILCDDRNIVRCMDDGFRVFGTWSHGESPRVSAADAPLTAVLFLRQSKENRLTRLTDGRQILQRLLPCVVRGFADGDWWAKTLDVAARLAREVSCYEMEFDKSGGIVPLLETL